MTATPPDAEQVLWGAWLSAGPADLRPTRTAADDALLQALVNTTIKVGDEQMDVQRVVWRSFNSPQLEEKLAISGLPAQVSLLIAQERSEPDAHRGEPVMAYLVELEKVLVPALRRAGLRNTAPIGAIFDALLEAAQRAVERAFFKDAEPAAPDSMAKIARYLLTSVRSAIAKEGPLDKKLVALLTRPREAAVGDEWPIEAPLMLAGPEPSPRIAREIVLTEKCFGLLRFRPVRVDLPASAGIVFYGKLGRALFPENKLAENSARWCALAMAALENGAEASLDGAKDAGALCRRITSFGYSASPYLSSFSAQETEPPALFRRAAGLEHPAEKKIFYALISHAVRPQLERTAEILRGALGLDLALVGDSNEAKAALSVAVFSLARAARFHSWIEQDESGTVVRLIHQTHVLRQNVSIDATLQAFYPPMFYSEKYRKDVKARLSFDPKTIEDEAISRIVFFAARRTAAADARELPALAEDRFRVPTASASVSVSKKDEVENLTSAPQPSKPAAPSSPSPAAPAAGPPPSVKPRPKPKPKPPAPAPAPSPAPAPAPAPLPSPKPAPPERSATIEEAIRMLTVSKAGGTPFIDGEQSLLRVSDLSFMRGFDVSSGRTVEDTLASAGLVNFCLKYVSGLAMLQQARSVLSWATLDADGNAVQSWKNGLDEIPAGSLSETDTAIMRYSSSVPSARTATVVAIASRGDPAWSFAFVVGKRSAWHFSLYGESPALTEDEVRQKVSRATGEEMDPGSSIVFDSSLGSVTSPADSAFAVAVLAGRIAANSPLNANFLGGLQHETLRNILSAHVEAMGGSLDEAAAFGRASSMSYVFRLGYVPQRALSWLANARREKKAFDDYLAAKKAAARPAL